MQPFPPPHAGTCPLRDPLPFRAIPRASPPAVRPRSHSRATGSIPAASSTPAVPPRTATPAQHPPEARKPSDADRARTRRIPPPETDTRPPATAHPRLASCARRNCGNTSPAQACRETAAPVRGFATPPHATKPCSSSETDSACYRRNRHRRAVSPAPYRKNVPPPPAPVVLPPERMASPPPPPRPLRSPDPTQPPPAIHHRGP